MERFEEEVQYFIYLVHKNVQSVKENKLANISKKEMIFLNFNISLDGQQIVVYHQEKDLIYEICVKKIQNFEFKYVDKNLVLSEIGLLTRYNNNKISLKKFLHLFCEIIK